MWTKRDVEELYRKHGFAVFRRCRALLGDEAEARDMMQEVFLKALQSPDAFQGRAAASTYLFSIATNLCFHRLRHSSIRNGPWQESVALRLSREEDLEQDTSIRDLWSRLLEESDEQTALIALYHFADGIPQGEIGEMLGLSRVTINQRLQRFRAAARAAVGEVG